MEKEKIIVALNKINMVNIYQLIDNEYKPILWRDLEGYELSQENILKRSKENQVIHEHLCIDGKFEPTNEIFNKIKVSDFFIIEFTGEYARVEIANQEIDHKIVSHVFANPFQETLKYICHLSRFNDFKDLKMFCEKPFVIRFYQNNNPMYFKKYMKLDEQSFEKFLDSCENDEIKKLSIVLFKDIQNLKTQFGALSELKIKTNHKS